MNKRESIIALYQYIAEVIKSLKTEKKDIYNEEWYYFLESLPKHSGITFNYLDNKNNLSYQKILQVEKLPFLKPLAIDEELLEWISGDWGDYKSSVKLLSEKIIKENNSLKVANISDEEKEILEKLLKDRQLWIEEQKKIENVRKLFDVLYSKYLSLDRDSDTLELLVGNGIVKVPNEDICYPVLLKKVNFSLDAERNLITIVDSSDDDFITQELYLNFLAEVENVNLDNVFKLGDKIIENNIHPISKNDVIKDFFREFIHNLNPRAEFIEDKKISDEDNIITIEWKPILFIRKKDDGKIEAINNIIKDIEEGGEVPGYLTELVGIIENDKKEIEDIPDILFTKETNNEQVEIIKNIYSHKAVVVQGPPGTGKTHTIANLLGHFLAEGKNVLITSQTRKALEVLKEKIPNEIQDLCISMLDDDSSDLGNSVESISEKLGYLNLEKLKNEYEEIERNRNDLKEDIKNIKRKIFNIKYQESKPIIYNNESISLKEAGEFLRKNERELDKIPGIVSSGVLCPVNNEELEFLKTGYKKSVSKEEEKEIELGLNKISDFWSLEEFEGMLKAKKEFKSEIELLLENKKYHINDEILYIDDNIVIDLKKFKNYTNIDNIIPEELKLIEDWKKDVCIAGTENSGDRKIWLDFIKDIRRLYELTNNTKDKFFKKDIVYKDIDVSTAKKLIIALKDGLEKPGLFFKHKLRKAKKEIADRVTINKRILEIPYDCDVALEYTSLAELEENTKNSWKLLMTGNTLMDKESNNKNFFKQLYSYADQMEYLLNWYDKERKIFLNRVENAGFERLDISKKEGSPIYVDEINQIFDFIPKLEELITIGKVGLKYSEIDKKRTEYLEKIEGIIKENSFLGSEIKNAIEKENTEKYSETLKKLEVLAGKEELYRKHKNLLKNIKAVANLWADELEKGLFNEKVENIYNAWRYKQISQTLKELIEKPYESLQEDILEKSEELNKLTAELVTKKTWYNIVKFIEEKDNLAISQALRGWKQTIQKIGKGTGKNTVLYKKHAKEKMLLCQKVVPAWIMPLNKVFDTLNPVENKFDIVIVDEASQSDISSLILLYMAKKIIVVGDDKQVSPSDVGVNIDKINMFRRKYIKGNVANDDLYGVRASLYSIVSTTFQPISLREHFRSVPEIIGYSNKTSYDNQILPLRDSNSSILKPAIVEYKVDGKRDEKNKVNKVEAETIVTLIEACLDMKEYKNSSFGVISLLGDEQAELIQNLIVKRIPAIEIENHKILCGNPASFQGDERDVMFISLVDSSEENKNLRLVGEGVEGATRKRYNVAISRAKDQLWLVHSIDKNSLKEGDLRKELFEYINSVKENTFEKIINENTVISDFENEITKHLLERNYTVKQQWKVGSYDIDIVAIYGDKKIAIECDGKNLNHSQEKIIANLAEQEVLERCGWEFVRVRASQYFRNPDKAIKELILQLEDKGIYPNNKENHSNGNELLNNIKSKALELMEKYEEN
ncbi:disulfide isomerase [Fusobacterium nucleatum subsp. nucleatum]|uniref:Disulfide isomerase n=1 Tax=Fusobacterium nucleatum subsp. nucleatum TaxID=76856 RepID=A0A0X3Y2F5_FUSNC|nr:AAA domain-containing protein [Fusobacterium nucleatum]KUL98736.1 disulfide isomerase [Fusobacterium nucleatum subsp. nucleatum]MCG6841883.1 AAA family ATPase [Fusobacterium nucleatum]WMS30232.1 AAA domain-containing protein [Fusobacterium nucleatum]